MYFGPLIVSNEVSRDDLDTADTLIRSESDK